MSVRKRKREAMLSPAELRELLSYDCETGVLRWRVDRSIGTRKGSLAGSLTTHGYRYLKIRNSGFMAHRVIWAIVHDAWPMNEIDHINGVRSDNRLANLRSATRSENCRNRGGVKGVYWNAKNGKWIVQANKKYLGSFRDLTDAQVAYRRAAQELFGSYARQSPLE